MFKQFREACVLRDYDKVASAADALLLEWLDKATTYNVISRNGAHQCWPADKPQPDRLAVALSGIDPVPFDIIYSDIKDFDPSDPMLHPYWKEDGWLGKGIKPHENSVLQERINSAETYAGFYMGLPQAIFVARCGSDEDVTYLGMLKYYLAKLGNVGEQNLPFVQSAGQRNDALGRDALAAIRCCILINAHAFLNGLKVDQALLKEAVLFMFNDPYRNTEKMKKSFTAHKLASFALTDKGEWPSYEAMDVTVMYQLPIIQGVKTSCVAESEYYAMIKPDLDEEEQAAKDVLPIQMSEWKRLISCPITGEEAFRYAKLQSLPAISGFTRTNFGLSAKTQYDADFDASISHYPHARYLEEYIEKATRAGFDSSERAAFRGDIFRPPKMWLRSLHSMLTSRSSAYKKEAILIQMKQRKKSGMSKYAPLKTVKITSNSKRFLYFINPGKYLDESMLRGYSKENPVTAGKRDVVGGKKTRAIVLNALRPYLVETAIYPVLAAYQLIDPPEGSALPFTSSADFIIGKEVGEPCVDHGRTAYCTSSDDFIVPTADATAFDAYCKEANFRRFVREAMIRALREFKDVYTWVTKDYHVFKDGLVQLVATLWGDGFTLNVPLKITDEITIILDAMKSGELLTNVLESYFNVAVTKTQIILLEKAGLMSKLIHQIVSVLGDDRLEAYRMVKRLSVSELTTFRDMIVRAGAEANLAMNKLKSNVRMHLAEYLKKTQIFGMHVTLLNTQWYTAESVDNRQFGPDEVRSFITVANVQVDRGYDHDFAARTLIAFWNLRRSMRASRQEKRKFGMIEAHGLLYLPMGCLFLPASEKGVGMVPYAMLYSNGQIAIQLDMVKQPALRKLLAQGATAMGAVKSSIKQELLDAVLEPASTTPVNVMGPILQSMRSSLRADRIQASIGAYQVCRDHMPGRMRYDRSPEEGVRQAVGGMKELTALVIREKNDAAYYIWEAMDSVGEYGAPWTSTILVSDGDVVPQRDPITNWPCADAKLRRLALFLGARRVTESWAMAPSRIISMLKRDPYFPRVWTDEQIFDIIADEKNILVRRNGKPMVYYILVAMGASEASATAAVSAVSEAAAFYFRQRMSSISLKSTYANHLDLSKGRHGDLVTINVVPDDASYLRDFLLEVGMTNSISGYMVTGVLRRTIITGAVRDDGSITTSMEIRNAITGVASPQEVAFARSFLTKRSF